jgi:hypothetical protein
MSRIEIGDWTETIIIILRYVTKCCVIEDGKKCYKARTYEILEAEIDYVRPGIEGWDDEKGITSLEEPMKCFLAALILVVFAPLLAPSAATLAYGQQSTDTTPKIPFDASEPLQMPDGMYLGEIAGVAVNSKHHVFVYTRTGSEIGSTAVNQPGSRLFEFGPDGKFITEIGKNLYSKGWAHSVRVDKDDNIWLVDAASDEVVKLSPDYKFLMVLGRRDESLGLREFPQASKKPDTRPGWLYEPTDVASDSQGNIFVSDGYKNSRVHKYDKDGNIVKSIGSAEPGNGPYQFRIPHDVVVDDKGFVYVADRSNHRIQVFDNDLTYVRTITFNLPPPQLVPFPPGYVANIPDFGREADGQYRPQWPGALCITPGPTQYLYAGDTFPGRISKFTLDGKLVGQFGSSGMKRGQLAWAHALACPSENEVWTGELLTWRVQKFILHPEKMR